MADNRGKHRRSAVNQGRSVNPGFRDVFAVAEFRALWGAQLLSVAGDQLARVALTVLVYDQTRSALLAAVAYAASIVPVFLGGILLSGVTDRRPRRQVMIVCDLARVPLAALMAVPGVPMAVLIGLLGAVTAIGAPFASARAALYPEVLGEARHPLGTAVTMTSYQFAQVAGFVVGGAVVGLAGPRIALLADAGTFLVSAVMVCAGVQNRPAATSGDQAPARRRGDIAAGIRLVFGRRSIRTPMLLGWISAFYNVPDGLAAPLASTSGGGPVVVGMILAARVTERLRATIPRIAIPGGGPVSPLPSGVTVSIGVAVSAGATRDLVEFLAAADHALYQAKNAGRNRVHIISDHAFPRKRLVQNFTSRLRGNAPASAADRVECRSTARTAPRP